MYRIRNGASQILRKTEPTEEGGMSGLGSQAPVTLPAGGVPVAPGLHTGIPTEWRTVAPRHHVCRTDSHLAKTPGTGIGLLRSRHMLHDVGVVAVADASRQRPQPPHVERHVTATIVTFPRALPFHASRTNSAPVRNTRCGWRESEVTRTSARLPTARLPMVSSPRMRAP